MVLRRSLISRYSKLEHNGTTHHLQSALDFESVRPVQEVEIRHALLALEASTSAIQKQESSLKRQCEAFLKFQEDHLDGKTQAQRAATQAHQQRRKTLQNLSLEVQGQHILRKPILS